MTSFTARFIVQGYSPSLGVWEDTCAIIQGSWEEAVTSVSQFRRLQTWSKFRPVLVGPHRRRDSK